MKPSIKQWIFYVLPVLLWMGVIFYSSSQPYSKQDARPFLSETFDLSWVHTYFSSLEFTYAGKEISVERLGEAGFIEFFIRKTAHFLTYFILALLLFFSFTPFSFKHSRNKLILAFLITVLYAASDEWHQSFTAQRTPLVQDVLVDSMGGALAILILLMVKRNQRQ